MRKKSLFLIFIVVLAVMLIPVSSSFAQEIDVSSMSNEELILLLQQIRQKLETANESEAGTVEEKPTMAAVQPTDPEPLRFSVYENKKLTVKALPGYMFIQPTKESEPGPDTQPGKKPENNEGHYKGEPCVTPGGDFGTWEFFNGKWECGVG